VVKLCAGRQHKSAVQDLQDVLFYIM
jgi:hypothetical protein